MERVVGEGMDRRGREEILQLAPTGLGRTDRWTARRAASNGFIV